MNINCVCIQDKYAKQYQQDYNATVSLLKYDPAPAIQPKTILTLPAFNSESYLYQGEFSISYETINGKKITRIISNPEEYSYHTGFTFSLEDLKNVTKLNFLIHVGAGMSNGGLTPANVDVIVKYKDGIIQLVLE